MTQVLQRGSLDSKYTSHPAGVLHGLNVDGVVELGRSVRVANSAMPQGFLRQIPPYVIMSLCISILAAITARECGGSATSPGLIGANLHVSIVLRL